MFSLPVALGPAGPKGDTGAQGPAGPQGPQGATGANGNTVLSGTGAPDPSAGNPGDFYIDTAADMLFGPKTSSGWPAAGTSLVGPAGPTGDTGQAGPAGAQGPPGPAGTSLSAITDLNGLTCSTFGGGAGTIAVQSASSDNTIALKCNANANPTCTHSNGVGQTYTDCSAALGVPGDAATYSLIMAEDAAAAYIAANGGTAGMVDCGSGSGSSAVQVIVNSTSVIWETAGQNAGYVAVSTSTQQTCPTPGSDPGWN